MNNPDSQRTVLIVDDHPDIQTVLTITLQQFGYRAVVAGSGAEAIEVASTNEPDIAILDYRLPDIEGIELGKQLKDQAADRTIKLLLFSGLSDQGVIDRAMAEGFDAFMVKPVRMKELKEQLDKLYENCDEGKSGS